MLNGSNFAPWNGSVFLENVMCNGTERLGIECVTPGPGVVTSPECSNPNRTAAVQCFRSKLKKFQLKLDLVSRTMPFHSKHSLPHRAGYSNS